MEFRTYFFYLHTLSYKFKVQRTHRVSNSHRVWAAYGLGGPGYSSRTVDCKIAGFFCTGQCLDRGVMRNEKCRDSGNTRPHG